MDKSSAVVDGTPGVGYSTAKSASRRRSNTPDLSASTTTNGSHTSRHSSGSNSVVPSPLASRDNSPARQVRRTASTTRMAGTRSRKNSQHEQSPSRQVRPGITTSQLPTRSLSSTTTPTLLPASQEQHQIQAPTPQKPLMSDALRWPVSPRLRSPPPQHPHQFPRPGIPTRRSDNDVPAINVQRPSPSPQPVDPLQTPSESEAEDSGMRTPVRGPLETVQEVSLPNSPNPTHDAVLLEKVKEKLATPDNYSDGALGDIKTLRARPSLIVAHESGSDSSNNKNERRPTSVPPPLISRQSSNMSTTQIKSKQDGSTQSMTVETETVPSVPSVVLNTGPKVEGFNGTLRTKPSSETIKPKKEKKKSRKQPTVNAGNASSKADVFEATIASAVDEANTSDSEETFVYDSNPPDGNDRTGRRFHSRTPSATSMVSQADRQNLRSIYGVMEGSGPAHGPKKTMKFVNTFNTNGNDGLTTGDEDGKGSGRSAGGSSRGTARHHHHIGRWGRQPTNGHTSLFDNESPFPNAAKSKLAGSGPRNTNGPPSPRNHYPRGPYTKRSAMQMSSSYDMDDTTGADDERTPLMGSIRSARSNRSRRGPHNLRQAESQTFTRRSSYLNRFAACLVLTMMFMLVITGAIGFMFATSQPLTGIEITGIHNVVTSEQVLVFDLTVKAHNPNIVVVTIDHANLEIFAKSEHAGTDSEWRDHPDGPDALGPLDDSINDPPLDGPDDGDETKPNVLLGRITVFDSPLTFEGSLFNQGTSSSTGQMQLEYPLNSTTGGSKRWENIYQNEFDLIIKGVVKYTLPMSARVRSATVSGRKTVKPNSANDPSLRPNSTTLDSFY